MAEAQTQEQGPGEGRFALELATPEALAASGPYGLVIVPGTEGDFGVLAGHAPLVSSLRPGVVRAWREQAKGSVPDADPEMWFIPGGFAEAGAARLTVLVPSAEPLDALDAEAIKSALTNAREDLSDLAADAPPAERAAIERTIALAEARLQALELFAR